MSNPTLSLVIPTYNEKSNIPILLDRLAQAMNPAQISYEVIIVDDNSPDGTADLAESLSDKYPVRVVRRSGKLGLSSAVTTGWQAAQGDIMGVMDADLSHDPCILPNMVYSITNGKAEIAMASRYIKGGGISNWPLIRRTASLTACMLGWLICPVNDVTSGYMVCKKEVIKGVNINPIGFKINLEVLVRGNYTYFTEVPFTFVDRQNGQSKFNGGEIKNYLMQLLTLGLYWLRTRPKRKRVPYTKHPLSTR